MRYSSSFSFIAWLLLGAVAGVLVGMASASIQTAGLAPVGITSLVTGAVLGSLLVVIARLGHLTKSRIVIAGALACCLAAVVAEHSWFYQHYRQQWHRVHEESPAAAIFRGESQPQSLAAYLAEEGTVSRYALWLVDAALLIATGVGIVVAGIPRHQQYW